MVNFVNLVVKGKSQGSYNNIAKQNHKLQSNINIYKNFYACSNVNKFFIKLKVITYEMYYYRPILKVLCVVREELLLRFEEEHIAY